MTVSEVFIFVAVSIAILALPVLLRRLCGLPSLIRKPTPRGDGKRVTVQFHNKESGHTYIWRFLNTDEGWIEWFDTIMLQSADDNSGIEPHEVFGILADSKPLRDVALRGEPMPDDSNFIRCQ